MRLSPFDSGGSTWLEDSSIRGRAGPNCTFELFPSEDGESLSISNSTDSFDEFDIEDAESGTEYMRVMSVTDRPIVRWYSREQFKSEFFYDPLDPPRPQGVDEEEWKNLHAERISGRGNSSRMRLTSDRREFLNRIARLWNGEVVNGVHLLRDKCPDVSRISEGLNERELERLYYNTEIHRDLIAAFGSCEWFNFRDNFLEDTYILRKRVWYAPNLRGKTLINGRDELPDLRGDPRERLPHRVTTGLAALAQMLKGREVKTYYNLGGYIVDVVSRDENGQLYAGEVMTDHNGWKLHRETYQKLATLHARDITPYIVFDGRKTAYKVMNHWHRCGLAELPNGTYNSFPNISAGRKQIQQAYQTEDLDWIISDWETTDSLWRETLGSDGPEIEPKKIVSLDW